MSADSRFTRLFLEHLPPATRQRFLGVADLEAKLDHALALGQQAWPEISLCPAELLPFLAQRVDAEASAERSLANLRVEDLYLACACLEKKPSAAAIFQKQFAAEIEVALAKTGVSASLRDDVKQTVYERLFLTDDKRAAKINQYAGRGRLVSWVRVIAVRTALNMVKRTHKERPLLSADLVDLTDTSEDQEFAHLKKIYLKEFKVAFKAALASLTDKERNLLRYYVLKGMSFAEIGQLYRVHRKTVSLWLEKTKKKMLVHTRKALAEQLGAQRDDLDSILGLLQSRLESSLRPYLADEGPGPG